MRMRILMRKPWVKGILGSQYVQYQKKEITVNVVSGDAFNYEEKAKLISNVKSRLGEGMKVSINLVNKLERTKNGKVRQAICHVVEQP